MSGPPGSWRRGDPDRPDLFDHQMRSTPTVRIAAGDRWPSVVTALIGVFLLAALLKPWAEQALAPIALPPSAPAASGPAPSVGPDLLAGLREHCQEPLGWRVYSRETWNGRSLRAWRSLEPAIGADGPLDTAIPVVQLGPTIEALGYCSPWTGTERPPAHATVEAWQLLPTAGGGLGATRLALHAIAPDDPTPLGALYGPIGDRRDPTHPPTRGWPAGRYVFAIRADGWERWWTVEIAEPDPARPGGGSTAPSATP